ncbi:multicopper oxidase family protein [Azospirillum doebereinerae]|uniref:Multicopper oxidase family protein n=1 Tax=Azospirillum doebereinerae TaxID=92933 RepID=A0A3S0WUC2_9PROT|nr:multicopper oxidase family protein [Azospirillum doebereinerae]RUQ69722.1 multicopper oxidase family protein [Azospirillum doebereinerae]
MTTIFATPLGRRSLFTGASALALVAGLPSLGLTQGAAPSSGGDPLLEPETVTANPDTHRLDVAIDAVYGYYDLNRRPVALRSYDGGPRPRTLRVRAGDTLGLKLANRLPSPPPNLAAHGAAAANGHLHHVSAPVPGMTGLNVPHGFNRTNMHLHGMHVSPRSPADNVLLTVEPGQVQNYSYAIPATHPCGLNFYHAHEHGSVALQVASGMAGALIVEGKVDGIEGIKGLKDVVMLLQSLPVDAQGQLEQYATLDTGTQVYINGQRNPTIRMKRGEVQRWRLVNATHDRFLTLTLAGRPFVALGFDGNPLEETEDHKAIFLAPGNRAEFLVQAPEPGSHALEGGTNFGVAYGTIATVLVEGEVERPAEPYRGPLVDYAKDFGGHLRPVEDGEIVKGRRVGFGQVGTLPYWTWTIDGEPFAMDEKGFTAKLGSAEEWVLTNQTNDPHPFHIHINPFQVLEADGLPVPVKPGRWLDTITIPPHGRVRLRTRYVDYDGVYVFHCHTLVHEDQGMMRLFTVEA